MDDVSGVLVLDKHEGGTSHDMVNKIRRLYNTKKVGHTGTLDPMATGVLTVLIGRAAKAAEFLNSDNKCYTAIMRLGLTTDTGDITGKVLSQAGSIPAEEEVIKTARQFTGKLKQIPPMYSALKVGGKKLVDLARRGIELEREARDIEIFSLDVNKLSDTEYILDVHCSKGTYIRTLCTDIGDKLGCGGVMSSLRRTKSGSFDIKDAHTISQLEEMSIDERVKILMPTESLFFDIVRVDLPDFFARLAQSGAEIYQKKIGTRINTGERVRLYDKEGFFALGEVREYEDGSAIKPIKLFKI